MDEGPRHNLLGPPMTNPKQDPGTSNEMEVRFAKKLEDPETRTDPLSGVREIMMQAAWVYGKDESMIHQATGLDRNSIQM